MPSITADLLQDNPISIAPGQTRPIAFLLKTFNALDTSISNIDLSLAYRVKDRSNTIGSLSINLQINHKSRYEPHKVTHLHPGGVVSYAIVRAPSKTATCPNNDSSFKAPVMLQLHGAGLEADNNLVVHALDPLPDLCAWVIFPTGVTPWSADDWHVWGFADVQAAIKNIPAWIDAMQWDSHGVNIDKWFVGGHSNGGQGTWYTMLHWPDKVFAASPISGYLSIQEYVPYKFWRLTEPRKQAVIQAALNNYRHELLVPNAEGIPIQQQHGGEDDNVPAYHSRLMSQLLVESGGSSNYSEVAGKGHWWDGVITTDILADFYREQLARVDIDTKIPSTFEFVVANPADMGSKFGLKVLYLDEPGELGKVVATRDTTSGHWSLELHNILAFEWERQMIGSCIILDGVEFHIEDAVMHGSCSIEFWADTDGNWKTTVSRVAGAETLTHDVYIQ